MKPDFLILGAAKAGTSSLHAYLEQHPDLYCAPGESNFFAHEGRDTDFKGPRDQHEMEESLVRTAAEYFAQFEATEGARLAGEVSTHYLYGAQAAERIRHYVPDVKMVAILRHPVDRAFSAFSHKVREALEETTDFIEALRREERRIYENWEPLWHYGAMGYYADQLERYFRSFDREQIRVYLYDDFVKEPLKVYQDLLRFLGVDDGFVPDMSEQSNVSWVPKNWYLHRLTAAPSGVKTAARAVLPAGLRGRLKETVMARNLERPRLDREIRRSLTERYREDILKLQELLGRDLSHWLA